VHLTSSPVDWYAARAGGVVAYVLLSAVVSLGLGLAGKERMKRWPRFALEDVHRFGGLLVGTFVAIHVATIAIDSYLPFSPTALVVPLTSRYKPVWTGLGIVAAELLVALAVTNHYRERRLSYRFWRRVHYLNFAVWGAATLHGLGSGTDRSAPWFLAVEAAAVALIAGLATRRFVGAPRLALVGSAAAVACMLALGLGPLRFHPKPWNAASFQDALTGRVLRDNGATAGIVSLAGNGHGSQPVLVRADLLIGPQRLESTEFQMEYLPSGLLCRGSVTRVQGFGFDATCRVRGGGQRFVHAAWQPSNGPDVRGGVLRVHA
jgi:methionine sulfoxide reductase heme-binding subunit